jgi:hypothetical protein
MGIDAAAIGQRDARILTEGKPFSENVKQS